MTVEQSDLDKAQTASDILAALASLQWQADHDGEECPQDMIPTPENLNDFRDKMPWEAKAEAGERLAELVQIRQTDPWPQCTAVSIPAADEMTWSDGSRVSNPSYTNATYAGLAETLLFSEEHGADPLLIEIFSVEAFAFETGLVLAVLGTRRHGPATGEISAWQCWLPVAFVHQRWAELPDDNRPRHPLAPLLKAWQERAVEVEKLDTRDKAIVQESLFGWVEDAPAILTHSRHDNELPFRPGPVEELAPFLDLGLPESQSPVVPPNTLVLADQAGFGKLTSGAGARLDKRLLVFPLLGIPMSERRPGGRYTLRPSLREMVHGWLMPPPAETGTGKGKYSAWQPSRHAPTLRRAMQAVNVSGVILADGREWLPIIFRAFPDFRNLDSRAVIEAALPELDASLHGFMVNRLSLIAAGMISDMAFDGTLTLAALWDQAKATNGGFRIHATRPKALRDTKGFLTRADGSQITGHGNNPFQGRDGKLQWRKGDVPQRDWRHPEAVLYGEERHPHADKVPVLNRDDRRRLFYGHASDQASKQMRSHYAKQADQRLRALEIQVRVVIENCEREGWRILEPAPSQEIRAGKKGSQRGGGKGGRRTQPAPVQIHGSSKAFDRFQ
ncbi:MAG: hypothetical protein OXH76_20800 [Boseongicola sp.]|nr:hypothetical protein [Boseongicola sp.]